MLAKVGIISAEEGEMLVNCLEQIRQEYRSGNFNPGIDAEDVHFAVERRLTELIGDVGKKVHTARSRNDQVATDVRLYLRDKIRKIQKEFYRENEDLHVRHKQHQQN